MPGSFKTKRQKNREVLLLVGVAHTYPGLKELLQHLQLLLGPGPRVFWRHLELQRLVVLGIESHAALEHVRLEHDHARLVGVQDGQLEEGTRGRSEGASGATREHDNMLVPH